MKTIAALFASFYLTLSFIDLSAIEGKNLHPLFENYGLDVKNQGSRGTCSVFAIVGVLEFEFAHTKGLITPLSVEYLNWASNMVTGQIVDGSFFNDALNGLLKHGICSDEYFPYYFTNYTKKVEPSGAALKDAQTRKKADLVWIKEWDPRNGMNESQLTLVRKMLDAEHPVAIGFQWPKREEQYRKMVNGMMYVPPREGVYDGHSIIIVGYQEDQSAPGGGYFIFKNSVGMDWEDNGYGKMPYDYAARYANDGVVINLK
jgi:C1A family cysteine protease